MKKLPKTLIITPFNVGIYESLKGRNWSENWMNYRKMIFEKYTYPSIMNQTDKNFEWYLVFDKYTPDSKMKYSGVNIIKSKDNSFRQNVQTLLWQKERPSTLLITMRLDNDDVIHKDFIKETREIIFGLRIPNRKDAKGARVVNYDQGYSYSHKTGKTLLLKDQKCSTFIMVASHCHQQNAWTDLGRRRLKYVDIHKPMWMRIIHENNKCNRMEGSPCRCNLKEFFYEKR